MKKMLFIYNPNAGKGQMKNMLSPMMELFSDAGYEIRIYPTKKERKLSDVLHRGNLDCDLLVCSGGDGTLSEAVNALRISGEKIPIGYIPSGSANDFASGMGISSNLMKAARSILSGRTFSCDIGMFNQQAFIYVAAFGMFTDVSYETPQEVKNTLGYMAYVIEGAKRFFALKSYHMEISVEGQRLEDDFLFGMVSNSVSVGGMLNLAGKQVRMDDGLFEITLVKRPKSAIQLNSLITALMSGNMEESPCIISRKAGCMECSADEGIAWTLDGEYGGEWKSAKIKCCPRTMDILVPAEEE